MNQLARLCFRAVRAHLRSGMPTRREALEFCGCYAAALVLAFGYTILVGSQDWTSEAGIPPKTLTRPREGSDAQASPTAQAVPQCHARSSVCELPPAGG